MSQFLKALHSGRVLLMDGAMGTELQRAGIRVGECYEMWNLTHPDKVKAIQRSYVNTGAECLLTNTFQANPAALAKHGLQDKLEAINGAALGIARSVTGVKHFVIGDVGPVEDLDPGDFERTIRSLAPADAILLETWSDLLVLPLVERACRPEVNPGKIPILLSFTFRKNPVLRMPACLHDGGLDARTVAGFAQKSGIAALGVNCGRDLHLDDVSEIIRQYRSVTDLPLFARPNAGTPRREGDHWIYPHTPSSTAECLPQLLEAGVSMIGGCCGTTPDHIAAFRPIIDQWNAQNGF